MGSNTGRSYERLTQAIFAALLGQQLARNVDVQRNIKLHGKTAEHEIDVYWAFELAGITYATVVQCKDWARRVSQGSLLTLKAVLDDLPGQPRGVFVTRTGYQAGARTFAERNGIALYELREAATGDSLLTLQLALRLLEPEATNFLPIPDAEWAEAERRRIGASADRRFGGQAAVTTFEDEEGSPLISVRELVDSLVPKGMNASPPAVYTHRFSAPTFMRTGIPDSPRMKLSGVQVTIAVHETEENHRIVLGDIAAFILKNVTRAETYKFDKSIKPV